MKKKGLGKWTNFHITKYIIKRGWKVEKFSYHRVYSEIEDEVYEKKGLEKWTNFRITKYTVG